MQHFHATTVAPIDRGLRLMKPINSIGMDVSPIIDPRSTVRNQSNGLTIIYRKGVVLVLSEY